MLVLAAVTEAQLHRLRRAAAARFPLAHAPTWDSALTTIRNRPVELAVVDPLLGGAASATEIEQLRRFFPSPPPVLHTTPAPAAPRVLPPLGHSSIHPCGCSPYDHQPPRRRAS